MLDTLPVMLARAEPAWRVSSTVGAGQAAAVADHAHRLPGPRLQIGDQAFDLAGRLLGALGQAAHLIGDHGEAAAGLAGTGRLDGRIKGQQVGLLDYRLDHIEHASDLLALGARAPSGAVFYRFRSIRQGTNRHCRALSSPYGRRR